MTRRGAYQNSRTVSPSTLGQRIRVIRQAWGWTQKELAESLHVPQAAISQWEGGKSKPSGPALASLLNLFHLPESALFDGVGFSIPDYVEAEPVVSRHLVYMYDGDPSPIQLPPARPGTAWGIKEGQGAHQMFTEEEAVNFVREALQTGSCLWILKRHAQKSSSHESR